MPTNPAFEALYAVSPRRGRSPRTEPVKISRPPSRITRAAARAPRNAPVRFTSRTCRQTAAPVWRGPATIGEIPALQIHTSTPPHSATVASATASLKSSSVTSPLSTRDGPGSAPATAFRSFSVRATSATAAPACENACASSAPRPRLAPVITTRFPRPHRGRGMTRGSRSDRSSLVPLCTDQYTTRSWPPARPHRLPSRRPSSSRCTAGCCSSAASSSGWPPSTATARSPASSTSRSGRRRRRSGRAGRCAPRTSSPPPTAATVTAWPRAWTRSGCSPS